MNKRYKCKQYSSEAEQGPCKEARRRKDSDDQVHTICTADDSPNRAQDCPFPGAVSHLSILETHGRDLTRDARAGLLDPVIGCSQTITRAVRILSRRTKNNPVLVGYAGVGKTAIAEGLAQRLAGGKIKGKLRASSLVSIDLNSLQASSFFKGDFERLLTSTFSEAKEFTELGDEIILFFDELHTIIASGDASAIATLKPLLSTGQRVISATTTQDYKKVIEKDTALERRLAPIKVEEPSVEETIEVLQGIRENYEAFHGVKITQEALVQAAKLSKRYIADRQLPDKAVDLLDEAAAKLVQQLDNDETKKRTLDEHMIAAVVHEWTGVPVSNLLQTEQRKLIHMEEHIHKRLIGQDEPVHSVANAIRRSRSGLQDPNRPTGSFLFLGPTGVGKTELARALAEFLFDTEHALIRLDMSEYMERHSVARLFGSPPGYVGYDEGGQLTESVRKRPYSVVLFDEIEKAHQSVFDALLQIMDDGRLTDGKGRTVNFKNTIVLMTSNIGSAYIVDDRDRETTQRKIMEAVSATFRPEFLNRLDDILVFDRLDRSQIRLIVDLQLGLLQSRLAEQQLKLLLTSDAKDFLANVGYSPAFGARPLRRAMQHYVQDKLSLGLLEGTFKRGSTITGSLHGQELAFA